MWIAIVAVVVVAVGAVVAKLTWRPNADETHSVRNYRTALGTMEQFSERTTRSGVQVVGQTGPSELRDQPVSSSIHIQGRPGDPVVPPVPVRGSGQFPDPDVPLVFDDADPTGRHRRVSAEATGDGFRSDRARRQALQSMNHRPRRWAITVVVVLVLVAFGALAVVGSRRPKAHSTTSTTSRTGVARTTVPTHTSTTIHHHATAPPRTTTTTTTVPKQLIPVSSTSATASYSVSSASYRVTVAATGQCWVDATNRSTGATVWTGTLSAGSSQVIPATGPMSVELGAPAATLTVNGIPVVFPSPLQSPFVATFQPATPAATTTTTTTTAAPSTTTAAP
jgi:hypothetical protein